MDKAGRSAPQALGAQREIPIEIRQHTSLNHRVEPDHRAVNGRVRSMLGFQNFRYARIVLGGAEAMHMIRNGFAMGRCLPSREAVRPLLNNAMRCPRKNRRAPGFASAQRRYRDKTLEAADQEGPTGEVA